MPPRKRSDGGVPRRLRNNVICVCLKLKRQEATRRPINEPRTAASAATRSKTQSRRRRLANPTKRGNFVCTAGVPRRLACFAPLAKEVRRAYPVERCNDDGIQTFMLSKDHFKEDFLNDSLDMALKENYSDYELKKNNIKNIKSLFGFQDHEYQSYISD